MQHEFIKYRKNGSDYIIEIQVTSNWFERFFGSPHGRYLICGSGGCWYHFPSGSSCSNTLSFICIEIKNYIKFNNVREEL